MARRKTKKEEVKEPNENRFIVYGLILLLIAIIGLAPFGVVSNAIRTGSAFLVGTWWVLFLLFIGICSIYMLFEKKGLTFFSLRTLGAFLIIMPGLVITHTVFIKNVEGIDVNNFIFVDDTNIIVNQTLKSITNGDINYIMPIENIGGGMTGAVFGSLFTFLLTMTGAIVVSGILMFCGLILFSKLSVKEFFCKIGSGFKWFGSLFVSVNESDDEEEEVEEEKKVIDREEAYEQMSHVRTVVDNETGELKEVTWEYPPINLLSKGMKNDNKENIEAIKNNVPTLETVLQDFAIEGKVVGTKVGPAVTQYELAIKAGTRVNKILGLNREIALSLSAKDVRIQAPIPGKNTVGIELPNAVISTVRVRDVLLSANELDKKLEKKLLTVLGKDIEGDPKLMEIDKMPHLLVAGATGSGKSVCINSILASILMRTKPEEVKLVLIDPKKVELSVYNGVPHLLTPVVTDPRKANVVLQKIVAEMEHRYEIFERLGVKNINSYNSYISKKNDVQNKQLPYIVIIIDELADLMLVAAKEVEDSIMRITQMARAAGIHLIVATQRPSTDVITGLIKSNIPSRISFAVSSGIDSRTILDMVGAEKLLGKGDMLYLPQGVNTPVRIQGTFISEEETKAIVDYVCKQQRVNYDKALESVLEETTTITGLENRSDAMEEPLYNDIVDFVIEQGKASTSLLQRRFRLGYNRAARCIDLLEERGIIGPQNGSKPREVLVTYEDEE